MVIFLPKVKKCRICNELKARDLFYCRVHMADGLSNECKRCTQRLNYATEKAAMKANLCRQCRKPSGGQSRCPPCERRRNELTTIRTKELRKRAIAGYGSKCACCGEAGFLFLSLDHVNNDGAMHRRELFGTRTYINATFYKWVIDNNFPDRLQVLCYNCNMGKERNKGICPHKCTGMRA